MDRTDTRLSRLNMLSVNRLNAQIKLTEVWKALNLSSSPLNVSCPVLVPDARAMRSVSNNKLVETGCTNSASNSFISDGKKVWNNAPISITLCKSLFSAKVEISKFVQT